MNTRDVGGILAIIASTGLAALGIYVTKTTDFDWAFGSIILILAFTYFFPWSSKNK